MESGVEIALQWLAYAARVSVDEVLSWSLSDDQLLKVGAALSRNKLLNPPEVPLKVATFVCQCGCGTVFERVYRTRKPRYLNRSHQMRAYRARARERDMKIV